MVTMVYSSHMNTNQTRATSHTHEFLISGCANQWVGDHDHADCWAAFMAHQGQPAGTTYTEYYEGR